MHDCGYEPTQIARQLSASLRSGLLSGQPPLERGLLMTTLGTLLDVPSSSDPKSYLEIILLDAALENIPTAGKSTPAKVMSEQIQSKTQVVTEPHPSTFRKSMSKPPVLPAEPPPVATFKPRPAAAEDDDEAPVTASDAMLDKDIWLKVLAAVKAKHNTLFSIVRVTTPHFEPGIVTLECGFAFHQKRLSEKRNKEMLATIIEGVAGHPIRIQCIVGEATTPDSTPLPAVLPEANEQVHTVAAATPAAPPAPAPPQNDAVAAISNIFGGAEVLQS